MSARGSRGLAKALKNLQNLAETTCHDVRSSAEKGWCHRERRSGAERCKAKRRVRAGQTVGGTGGMETNGALVRGIAS
jgi:hypothetical protein